MIATIFTRSMITGTIDYFTQLLDGFVKYGSLFHIPLFIRGLKRTSYYKTTFYTSGARP